MTSRLNQKNKGSTALTVTLTVLLLAFLGLIFYINLSCDPEFYDGDIYSDINYAKEAWKAKSLFPKTWSFGNQTYVVATPVVAALIYGITKNAVMAMAVASCIMTVLIVLTYDWMLKTLCSYNERTAGFLVMASLILIKRHVAANQHGAQILFTMASYYACYIITAFLVYGCYVRIRDQKFKKTDIPILAISVALSFGTGMQSFRQTAIMVCPLIVVEALMIIVDSVRNKKLTLTKSTAYTAVVSVANIGGLAAVKFIDYSQTTIYGDTSPELVLSQILTNAYKCVYNMLRNFWLNNVPSVVMHLISAVFIAFIFAAFILELIDFIKSKGEKTTDLAVTVLFALGCLGILAADIFTSMKVRTVYYIMMFPLLATSVSLLLKRLKGKIKIPFYCVFVLFTAFTLVFKGVGVYREINRDKSPGNPDYQVAEYMAENGYDTLYSIFGFECNGPEGIAVISGDRIKVLYFNDIASGSPFTPIKYLCVKDSYKNADNSRSLYLIKKSDLASYMKVTDAYGVKFEKVAEFGDEITLCKASDNLTVIADEAQNNS